MQRRCWCYTCDMRPRTPAPYCLQLFALSLVLMVFLLSLITACNSSVCGSLSLCVCVCECCVVSVWVLLCHADLFQQLFNVKCESTWGRRNEREENTIKKENCWKLLPTFVRWPRTLCQPFEMCECASVLRYGLPPHESLQSGVIETNLPPG